VVELTILATGGTNSRLLLHGGEPVSPLTGQRLVLAASRGLHTAKTVWG